MIISNPSGPDGIIQECERICRLGAGGISGNIQKLRDFISRINMGIDRYFALAEMYDSNWGMDDRRYADDDLELPVKITGLVSGIRDYLMPIDMLSFDQLFVKDPSGVYQQLTEIDDKRNPEEYLEHSPSGTPTAFKRVGNSIIFNVTPNYSMPTNGIRVPIKRNGKKFGVGDSAVTPGIPVLFHPYLARYASYPYLTEQTLKNASAVLKQIGSADPRDALYGGDEAAIATFVANRAKPKTARMTAGYQNNK